MVSTVINNIIGYVQWRIKMLGLQWDYVYNVNKTNVLCSFESINTWTQQGSKEVAIAGADLTSGASAMLGCNTTGTDMLKVFLIYDASANPTFYQELI
jgi:hypothetical protein